jgi:hypothetical protein
MNKKLKKTFIKHYIAYFETIKRTCKWISFFLKMTFFSKFLTWTLIKCYEKNFLKTFLKIFWRIFLKYFPKSIQKASGCGSCYPICTYWTISNAFHTIVLLTTIDQLLVIQWNPQSEEGLVIGNCGKFC